MRQKKNKKPMDRAAVALVLCFSVVAIASVFTVKSSLDKIDLSDNGNMNISKVYPSGEQSVTKRVPTVDSKDNPSSGVENENGNSGTNPWIAPVEGSLSLEYSTEMPIYSKTLDQYMVHSGVDIATDLDSRVQAVANGTIVDICRDDRFGEAVKINHGNGFITTYSNLSDAITVEVGDVVKQGDILGSVGNTALFESAEDSHLHFEMEKDNNPINPSDYIQF